MRNQSETLQLERATRWIVFVVLLFSYSYFFPRWADPNQNSRLNMVVAIVEDGTFRIDKYVDNTVDYAKVGEHYYSDKAPGIAFLGVPLYWGLKFILELPILEPLTDYLSSSEAFGSTLNPEGTGIQAVKIQFAIAQVALTFFLSALPSALLGVLILEWLRRFTQNTAVRLSVVLVYGMLTPAFIYANAYYGHQLSAVLLFSAFFLISSKGSGTHPIWSFVTGGLLAYSVVSEYPTFLIVGILSLYAGWIYFRLGKIDHLAWFAISAVMIALGWMGYNNHIFGGPFNLGYSYSELWQDQHQTGFMSLSFPTWEAIWGITFSAFRGLFFYSPILLLALPGFLMWRRSGLFRLELIVTLMCSLAMFFFNSTSAMWWGGFAVGPRYLLPGLPFLALPLVFIFQINPEKFRRSIFLWPLLMWSAVMVWGVGLAGQSYPPDTIWNPVLDYALIHWLNGNIARNFSTIAGLSGIASLYPWLSFLVFLLGVWYFFYKRNGTTSSYKNHL
jgi:hypothetical protein